MRRWSSIFMRPCLSSKVPCQRPASCLLRLCSAQSSCSDGYPVARCGPAALTMENGDTSASLVMSTTTNVFQRYCASLSFQRIRTALHAAAIRRIVHRQSKLSPVIPPDARGRRTCAAPGVSAAEWDHNAIDVLLILFSVLRLVQTFVLTGALSRCAVLRANLGIKCPTLLCLSSKERRIIRSFAVELIASPMLSVRS